jgi:hypothetical protein
MRRSGGRYSKETAIWRAHGESVRIRSIKAAFQFGKALFSQGSAAARGAAPSIARKCLRRMKVDWL